MSEPTFEQAVTNLGQRLCAERNESHGLMGYESIIRAEMKPTFDALKAEIERLISDKDELARLLGVELDNVERLTRERDAAEAVGAQQETDGIVHTLRSMAKNLKPEFAQMMNVAADAFEKFPRPKSSALGQVKAQARLEEIKAFDCDSIFTSENKRKRIAELEAAAGRKS
jgi:hypothetical protein